MMGGATNGLIAKVGNLATMFKSFGKGGAIGMVLAAAGGLISAMSAGIKSSEETTKKWRKELAQVKPIINDLDIGLERMGRGAAKIASFFLTILGAITNFANFIVSGFKYNQVMDAANDAIKEAVELEEREIANETELNNLSVLEVSAQTRINELKAIAADTDHKSYAERKAALEEIDAIEETFEKRKIAAAKEAYDIQVANRKGEHASVEEAKKERELYIAYLQAKSDAQSKDIAREKEIYQLQKDAGQEALDYRIRILESERNLLETQISMVEANTVEEYNLRRAVADKEYEIAVATAEKEKKNMTLKNKQLLEAEQKHYADLQQIEEDFTAGYLQRIKDQTDTAVANTVDAWKKSIPKLEGLLKEYNTKLAGGKPATQTSDEWNKELAQMRDEIRKTWIDGINDIFGQVDNIVFQNLQKDFKIWQEGTADYLASEITAYENAYNEIASKREEILKSEKMEGETDEQFQERQKQKTLAFDKNLYEMRKKIVEGYHNWYFKAESENNTKILLASRKNFEEYVKGIPHSVWDYMFKPQDYTMENMEQDLKNAETKYKIARENIEKIMRAKWKEAGKKEEDYNFNEAFNMLPEDVQKAYLADLEDFVDKENKLLKQRLDN